MDDDAIISNLPNNQRAGAQEGSRCLRTGSSSWGGLGSTGLTKEGGRSRTTGFSGSQVLYKGRGLAGKNLAKKHVVVLF